MSTTIISYNKTYLLQDLGVNFLMVSFLVSGNYFIAGFSWETVIITIVLLFLFHPQRDFFDALLGTAPALELKEEGFIDFTRQYTVGLVPWDEVKAIEKYGLIAKNQVRVVVHEPKQLVDHEKRFWKRLAMQRDILLHGTPFVWHRGRLGIKQQDFLTLLQELKEGKHNFNDLGRHLIEQ